MGNGKAKRHGSSPQRTRRTQPLDHALRRAQGREHGRTARAALSEVEGQRTTGIGERQSKTAQASTQRSRRTQRKAQIGERQRQTAQASTQRATAGAVALPGSTRRTQRKNGESAKSRVNPSSSRWDFAVAGGERQRRAWRHAFASESMAPATAGNLGSRLNVAAKPQAVTFAAGRWGRVRRGSHGGRVFRGRGARTPALWERGRRAARGERRVRG